MIFDIAGRIETGRYDAGSSRFFPLPLKTGKTLAVLKDLGTFPVASDMFTRWASGPTKTSVPFLRMEVLQRRS
jgi:hypothetical protein